MNDNPNIYHKLLKMIYYNKQKWWVIGEAKHHHNIILITKLSNTNILSSTSVWFTRNLVRRLIIKKWKECLNPGFLLHLSGQPILNISTLIFLKQPHARIIKKRITNYCWRKEIYVLLHLQRRYLFDIHRLYNLICCTSQN